MKKKTELLKIKKIIEIVNQKITNDELRDDIIGSLEYFANNITPKFNGELDNELSICYKSTGDIFKIGFYPSLDDFNLIKTECSRWGKREIENKVISYDNDTVTIEVTTLDNYTYSNSNKISEILYSKIIRKYQNDSIIYKYDYDSTIRNEIKALSNSTTEEETFINGSRAVKKTNTIKQDGAFGFSNGICYSGTNFYCEPCFNSSKNHRSRYVYGMHEITENEYNEFIKNIKTDEKQLTKV